MEINQKLRIKDGLVWQEVDGNTVVVSPQTGKVRVLNGLGSSIWYLLVDENTPNEIQDQIVAQYNVSPERASQDINSFLNDLHQKGLLV